MMATIHYSYKERLKLAVLTSVIGAAALIVIFSIIYYTYISKNRHGIDVLILIPLETVLVTFFIYSLNMFNNQAFEEINCRENGIEKRKPGNHSFINYKDIRSIRNRHYWGDIKVSDGKQGMIIPKNPHQFDTFYECLEDQLFIHWVKRIEGKHQELLLRNRNGYDWLERTGTLLSFAAYSFMILDAFDTPYLVGIWAMFIAGWVIYTYVRNKNTYILTATTLTINNYFGTTTYELANIQYITYHKYHGGMVSITFNNSAKKLEIMSNQINVPASTLYCFLRDYYDLREGVKM